MYYLLELNNYIRASFTVEFNIWLRAQGMLIIIIRFILICYTRSYRISSPMDDY